MEGDDLAPPIWDLSHEYQSATLLSGKQNNLAVSMPSNDRFNSPMLRGRRRRSRMSPDVQVPEQKCIRAVLWPF